MKINLTSISRARRIGGVAWLGAAILFCSSAPAQSQDLYVSNSGGPIYRFTPGGVQSTFASGLSSPEGLAFDSAGNLFVADRVANGTINEFTPGGARSIFASGLSYPEGLAFDNAGNLFATDPQSGNI